MTGPIHSSHWGAFHAQIEGDRLVGVTPFAHDKEPSSIIEAWPGMVHAKSRVRAPSVRRGWLEKQRGGTDSARRGDDSYVELPWDQALDLVAGELQRVRATHGNAAIFAGSYGWSSAGRFHHARSQLHRFLNLFGGFTAQINSYSFAAGQALLPHIVGTLEPLVGPVASWDGIAASTRLMVCFGGVPFKNSQVEAGGMGEHSAGEWLQRCGESGVEFINISPLRQDFPDRAAVEWRPIRPNSDTALILALAHVLLVEGLHDTAFLASHCIGFERFAAYLRGESDGIAKTPAWAAALTGIKADWIIVLARKMASRQTMISAAWSLQRAEHGEQPYWAIIALAAMLGQIGTEGGGFGFGYGAESGMGAPRQRVVNPTLAMGANPIRSTIPVARIADMLLDPGGTYAFNGQNRTYPDARLVYWCGGNPFHHHQDLNRLADAFQRPETIVVNESWWTATARHADIVLPATTTLERDDIGASSRDRFIMAMKQAVPPQGAARHDFDIFRALAARLGLEQQFAEGRDAAAWVRHLYEEARERNAERGVVVPPFESFWEAGHHEVDRPAQPFVPFADFRRDPLAHRLNTPSGKIEIFSETIAGFGYDDCPGHPVWLPPTEWHGAAIAARYPLHMLSNQPKTRLHSQMDAAGPSLAQKIRGREPVWLNRSDAGRRGIAGGDIVRVFNDRGQCLAGAVLTDELMAGVIQFPTGAWYDPQTPGGLERHGNPNVLTRDAGTSRLAQGPVAHSCLVEIELWRDVLPPVEIHDPPEILPA